MSFLPASLAPCQLIHLPYLAQRPASLRLGSKMLAFGTYTGIWGTSAGICSDFYQRMTSKRRNSFPWLMGCLNDLENAQGVWGGGEERRLPSLRDENGEFAWRNWGAEKRRLGGAEQQKLEYLNEFSFQPGWVSSRKHKINSFIKGRAIYHPVPRVNHSAL